MLSIKKKQVRLLMVKTLDPFQWKENSIKAMKKTIAFSNVKGDSTYDYYLVTYDKVISSDRLNQAFQREQGISSGLNKFQE